MKVRWLAVVVLVAGCSSAPTTAASPELPNRSLTPGAVFPHVTVRQVCVPGYTAKVRNVPKAERLAVFKAYGIPYAKHSQYELDHLISLELGGSNEPTNLWPEFGPSPNLKDKVENRLHALVCAGKVPLATAQHDIATDWRAALKKYG